MTKASWEKIACWAAALLVGSGAAPATAQVGAGATAATGCELHVWPAERFKAVTTGWGSGFGMIGAIADSAGHAKGDQGRKAALASALDSPGQTAALASLGLPELLGQPGATVVRHDEPLDRKTVNKIETRRAPSTSPCYAELIVADLLYQKAAIYGRSLKTLFIYRRFGPGQDKPVTYKGWGGNGLKLFPPKPGEDIEAANAELVDVFKNDFREFAKNAVKAPELAAK